MDKDSSKIACITSRYRVVKIRFCLDVDKSANNEYPFSFVMKADGGFNNQSNNNEEKNLESSPRRSLWL